MIILIDLDGVTVDFQKQLIEYSWKYYNQGIDDYKFEDYSLVVKHFFEIYSKDQFFETLEPIEGSLETIEKLNKAHDCYIVTAPAPLVPTSLTEKQRWVNKYLPDLSNKIFVTKHKHMVNGDILIDDFSHNLEKFPNKSICFNQPWNKNHQFEKKDLHRVDNWKEIEDLILSI